MLLLIEVSLFDILYYALEELVVVVLWILSLVTSWNVFTVLDPIFDSSFTFSFVC
jgi:TRAP-type C4-dicarboxylate transport system permease small subunit